MFWSEQILVNRKSGVATVWLVATLGSRSGLKKVTRKEILNVDVPKACGTILEPGAPLALRLQGNLMYGVVRVFSQQCEYVLSDVQGTRDRMKCMLKALRTAELDPDAGKARPDQINVPYDPCFVLDPMFAMPDDIFAPSLSIGSSRPSSRLSPLSRPGRPSQLSEQDAILGLDIGTSDTGAGNDGDFAFPYDLGSSAQKSNRSDFVIPDVQEDGFIVDPGFDFDIEGNIIEYSPSRLSPAREEIRAQQGSVEEEYGVRTGLADVEGGGPMEIDDFRMPIGDDVQMGLGDNLDELPDLGANQARRQSKYSSVAPDEVKSSETAEAPQRARKKAIRIIQLDAIQELRKSELAEMNTGYAANMEQQAGQRSLHKIAAQAKKNALFWVWNVGIGGVGRGLGKDHIQHPLHVYSGEQLYSALLGQDLTWHEKKRKSSPEESSINNEARRKRAKKEVEYVGRGEGTMYDEGLVPFDDDGIEIGRDAPSALADISSQMPWNVTGSVHGSRPGSSVRGRPLMGSVGGFPSSARRPSSLPGIDLSRRGSRLTSASPLTGRGPVLERLSSLEVADDEGLLGGEGQVEDQDSDDFQLYGPGAAADTQTAAQSQWMRAKLDQESSNFFGFLQTEAAGKNGIENGVASVTFEGLLPPAEHSKTVAAQAFHHVLALASKGLIVVVQEEGYGEIHVDIAVEI